MQAQAVGYYSMGLCGYEVTVLNEERARVRFVGTAREHRGRVYSIQYSISGRAYVRPVNMRVYLDECIRIDN